MSLPNMQSQVRDELAHILKGQRGSPQRRFRAFYAMERQHDLSSNPAALRAVSLIRAVADIRKHVDPNFKPDYDRDFFD